RCTRRSPPARRVDRGARRDGAHRKRCGRRRQIRQRRFGGAAAGSVATDRRAPRRDASGRLRQRASGAAGARTPQAGDTVKRRRAGGAVANPARPYLRDRAARRGRQVAADRSDARRTVADPVDRAISAFHARDILCSHDPLGRRSGRAISHRGSDQTGIRLTHMTINDLIARYHSRLPALATALYLVLIAVLGSAIWNVIAGILEQRTVIAAATDLLARLEGRKPTASGAVAAGEDTPIGSPFLEGPTVTVAGAALLQRMAAAVTKVGGNILSSQVELQGSQS